MAISEYCANSLLDLMCGRANWTRPSAWYLQLHTGDPGSGGTANAWTAAGRQPCAQWDTSTYGWLRNAVDVLWTGLPDTAGITAVGYATLWTQSSGGVCLHTFTLTQEDGTAARVVTGQSFLIPAGYLFVQWVRG